MKPEELLVIIILVSNLLSYFILFSKAIVKHFEKLNNIRCVLNDGRLGADKVYFILILPLVLTISLVDDIESSIISSTRSSKSQ